MQVIPTQTPAYDKGYEAGLLLKYRHENPYLWGTANHSPWDLGWHAANRSIVSLSEAH